MDFMYFQIQQNLHIRIKWDDPTIGVKWPIPDGTTPNISEKDGKHPAFTDEISLYY